MTTGTGKHKFNQSLILTYFATIGTSKKYSKRAGETQLFDEYDHLTDDALYACKYSGVDPKDLYPK